MLICQMQFRISEGSSEKIVKLVDNMMFWDKVLKFETERERFHTLECVCWYYQIGH